MATVPSPSPDYDSPEPSSMPTELPPMPGDTDMPVPIDEPMPEGPAVQGA